MLEKKQRSRLENGSEGGANSVEDEGFGRSTLSADITTATWGGSTQMSSTQNDSAVSDEGSSHDGDEEVTLYFGYVEFKRRGVQNSCYQKIRCSYNPYSSRWSR